MTFNKKEDKKLVCSFCQHSAYPLAQMVAQAQARSHNLRNRTSTTCSYGTAPDR
jgi:hypothetical protein